MRWHNVRVRDFFGPLYLMSFVGWSLASHLICDAYHPVMGAIITTPTKFPAIPVPSYLIPYLSRLSAVDAVTG